MAMRDHFGEPDQREAVSAAQAAALSENSRKKERQSKLMSDEPGAGEARVVVPVGSRRAAQAVGAEARTVNDEDDWIFSFIKIDRIQVRHFRSSSSLNF
jgi:hypothetical protein